MFDRVVCMYTERERNVYCTSGFQINTLLQKRTDLGHELHLQLDSASENKCLALFSFCGLLTHFDVVKTCTLGYLPPGHTVSLVS